VKPSEIYRRMKVQYGDSCLSQGRVYEWVERFQNGIKNVSDEQRRGRPVSVATGTVKQQIEQRIRDYRQVTIDEIAVEFNIETPGPSLKKSIVASRQRLPPFGCAYSG
jgi:transposase